MDTLKPDADWLVWTLDFLYIFVWKYLSAGLEVNKEKALIFQEGCHQLDLFLYQFEWPSTYFGIDFSELSAARQNLFFMQEYGIGWNCANSIFPTFS